MQALKSTGPLTAIALLFGVGACSEKPADPAQEAIKTAYYGAQVEVEKQLRDPSSAQYTDTVVYIQADGGYVTCGYVNAANAFGGMTGPKPFFGNQAGAVIGEGELLPVVTAAWSQACVNRAAFQP